MKRIRELIVLLVVILFGASCSQIPGHRPGVGLKGQTRAWKMHGSDRENYFQYLDSNGKIEALAFDDNRDNVPEVRVDFLTVGSDASVPHYVILLDGIPYDLVKQMYDEGYFRLFYQPSKMVSVFPSNTDVAYAELFMPGELLGFEASYYDRSTKKMSKGDDVYLKGLNEPWAKSVTYRAPMWLDPIGYVNPDMVFTHELLAIEKMIDKHPSGTAIGYFVGTANMGTRQGSQGFRKCLEKVDRLCEKVVYERRGRCRITILSDHGHNLTPSKYFDITGALKDCGFRVTDQLCTYGDVVCIQFGLLTCSALYTDEPATVAERLMNYRQLELAIYPQEIDGQRRIAVRDASGLAFIEKDGDRYRYVIVKGDPLKLKPILAQLRRSGKVDSRGTIDDRALFEATVNHEYPDPLARIWRAFDGMVKYPPDLVVTTQDGWFCGKPSFARTVNVASTHGSLNYLNSMTFVMSTMKPLPRAMRITDIPREIKICQ